VLAGADEVFDAAIRRAGMLRVENLLDLFVAVETLARGQRFAGDRLMIVSNGGGAGVLAADATALGGARLARLSDDTVKKLDALLPPMWSRANPIDIIGDAPVSRYVETLKVLGDAPEPTPCCSSPRPVGDRAGRRDRRACVPVVKSATRPVLSCWMGAASVEDARRPLHAGRHRQLSHARGGGARLRALGHLPPQPGAAAAVAAGFGRRARARRRPRPARLLRAALTAGQQWLTDRRAAS